VLEFEQADVADTVIGLTCTECLHYLYWLNFATHSPDPK